MGSRFEAASLVASPLYPNAIVWSDENLVAVASAHLVTILDPAMPFGPRGLITIPASKPFPIGVIERKDLFSNGLLPTTLSRDLRPCVRSISWSPIGIAPNSGCLLAVCTTEGRVKIYRFPFCEFSAEWVEVMDISEMLYTHLANINFGELDVRSSNFSDVQVSQLDTDHGCEDLPISILKKKYKRRRQNALDIINEDSGTLGNQSFCLGNNENAGTSSSGHTQESITAVTEVAVFSSSLLQQGSSVEVLTLDENQRSWVAGTLDHLEGAKAHIVFPETDGNGNRDKWVEIDIHSDKFGGPKLLNTTVVGQEKYAPEIRPSMHVGNFPKQISANCRGLGDIFTVGQPVEAWRNHRWFEGVFMGLDESGLQVKLYGDTGLVTMDTSSVRLAPIWINEQKSWQVTVVNIEMKGLDLNKAAEIRSDNLKENNPLQVVSMSNFKAKSRNKVPEKNSLPLITADQYASHNAMLSSLVVAWSPILRITSELGLVSPDNTFNCCSILAVGGKSGKVSLWKFDEPKCYSIMHSRDPPAALLIGLLQAHNTWITTITWALLVSEPLNPQLLLATGSSDGSVKIWWGHCRELLKSSEASCASFSLLKEVVTADSVPVSVLSLTVPVQTPHNTLLAVGKGSGSLEIWICELSTRKFVKAGSYDAHDHIVTGLAWAFDGTCLYTCSQDNSMHSWILQGNSLCKAPIPSNTPGVKSSNDVPNVFDSCFGVAVSPGNLVVAVVRSFDADLLNPMYQARSQKAAVEFLWIGGQKLDISSKKYPDFNFEAFPGFPDEELVYWEYNILWSLNCYKHPDKPLVIWDIVAALLAFKQSAPKYVEHILAKWLISYMGSKLEPSLAKIVSQISTSLSDLSSRQLHLINVITRRVILADMALEKINSKKQRLEGIFNVEEEKLAPWVDFLESSENELRERLVGFSFSVFIYLMKHSSTSICKPGYWWPVGLAQMEKWVSMNHVDVRDLLKLLALKTGKLGKRTHPISEYAAEEQCSYCSASVPFECTETASCQGEKRNGGVGQSHDLTRCAVSMQVCPTTPSWFCVCCHRRVSKFAPETFFTMPKYLEDFNFNTANSPLEVFGKPLCPFCGILLHRLQPAFPLSASLV